MPVDGLSLLFAGKDVVLVVGLYKSGTSLAVELCAGSGFNDPSASTNPTERGFGLSLCRYLTHECSVLRGLNEGWLKSCDPFTGTARAERYLVGCDHPVVLKDPRFLFTLPRWVAAAHRLHLRVGVLFPDRSRDELRLAWEAAPFTRDLLRRNLLQGYLAAFEEQKAWCRKNRVPHLAVSLNQLRLLRPPGQPPAAAI